MPEQPTLTLYSQPCILVTQVPVLKRNNHFFGQYTAVYYWGDVRVIFTMEFMWSYDFICLPPLGWRVTPQIPISDAELETLISDACAFARQYLDDVLFQWSMEEMVEPIDYEVEYRGSFWAYLDKWQDDSNTCPLSSIRAGVIEIVVLNVNDVKFNYLLEDEYEELTFCYRVMGKCSRNHEEALFSVWYAPNSLGGNYPDVDRLMFEEWPIVTLTKPEQKELLNAAFSILASNSSIAYRFVEVVRQEYVKCAQEWFYFQEEESSHEYPYPDDDKLENNSTGQDVVSKVVPADDQPGSPADLLRGMPKIA